MQQYRTPVDSAAIADSAIMMCTVDGHTVGVGEQLTELRMGSWSETSDRPHQLPILFFRSTGGVNDRRTA